MYNLFLFLNKIKSIQLYHSDIQSQKTEFSQPTLLDFCYFWPLHANPFAIKQIKSGKDLQSKNCTFSCIQQNTLQPTESLQLSDFHRKMPNTSSIYKKTNFSCRAAGAQLSNLQPLLLSLPVDGALWRVCICKLLSGTCPCWRSNLFPSVHSVKTSSKPAGGFMRTCAAGCLSTPLTSQMVGWTWTHSESESSPLLCHTGAPLAAPHLSVTFCLRYICAASVSHLGPSPAKMTVSDVLLLSHVPVWTMLL